MIMKGETRSEGLSDLEELANPGGGFREAAFGALVGLAAKHGGGSAFFGDTAALASDAFRKSLVGHSFPSFWMEVPLSGNPGFDLHVCYSRGQVLPGEHFDPGCGFGMQAMFDWFFAEETSGVGVEFAHDLRDGNSAVGAYVNFNGKPLDDERGFFASLGANGAHSNAAKLLSRMPNAWFPWYLGLFPDRPDAGVRVGAFVSPKRQAAYAANTREIAYDLAQAGFTALDDCILKRLSALSALPFDLELQLDATEYGTGDTLGADLTLTISQSPAYSSSAKSADIAKACELLEAWNMADSRWRNIAGATISRIAPIGRLGTHDAFLLMECTPAFIKAKWTATEAQPAKVYFKCSSRLFGKRMH